jgi:hypothetical protein
MVRVRVGVRLRLRGRAGEPHHLIQPQRNVLVRLDRAVVVVATRLHGAGVLVVQVDLGRPQPLEVGGLQVGGAHELVAPHVDRLAKFRLGARRFRDALLEAADARAVQPQHRLESARRAA